MSPMGFISTLLFEGEKASFAWIKQVTDAIKVVLWPILILVCAAGLIYAVVLGVNMARADSTDKREEAKKRLINVLIGLAIIVALILFFQLLANTILPALLPGIYEGTDVPKDIL